MSQRNAEPVVATGAGALRGQWRDGVAAFQGVPYAEPPVGPLRFAPSVPAKPWEGTRDALTPGAAAPQPPPRAGMVMGPMVVPGFDEDCLTLSVWSASPDPAAKLPVLVWFHGGGFMFGAGSAEWHDGTVMARRGQMVVVSVNYRLGALGWLYLPNGVDGGKPVANLGLQDQCLALEWVRDNIAAFGGDPSRVTIAGQSAGGISVVGLHAVPRAEGLFQRAITWSSGLQMPANSPEQALLATDRFLDAAGAAGNPAALADMPVEQILAAQDETIMRYAMAVGCDPRLRPASMAPFQLVVDGDVLPVEPAAAARAGSMDRGDLMIGMNANEMGFAFGIDEAFWQRDEASVREEVQRVWGPAGAELFERYVGAHPGESAPQVLCTMLSEEGTVPSIDLAERRASVGRPAYFAWFTWGSTAFGGRLGACHTAELPFVFGNREQWAQSPLIEGASAEEFGELSSALQNAWIAFCATGHPGAWPPYLLDGRAAMEFGRDIRVTHDPAPVRSSYGLTFAPQPVQ